MNKHLTEIVFILDRSGSMSGLEADTIGGYNTLLEKQRREPGEARLSTVLFNHTTEVLHDRVDIRTVAPLTEHDYRVGGSTALLDAIGGAIDHIGRIHKYARPEDRPAHTLIVIVTDGMENASRRYSGPEIKRMVERQRRKYGWEFLFLGANVDAFADAEQLGIDRNHATNYHADGMGLKVSYCATKSGNPIGDAGRGSLSEKKIIRRRGPTTRRFFCLLCSGGSVGFDILFVS